MLGSFLGHKPLGPRPQPLPKQAPVPPVPCRCHRGYVLHHLIENKVTDHFERYIQCDMSSEMLASSRRHNPQLPPHLEFHQVCVDEEYLPFQQQQFDLVVTNLSFHWVNDLQVRSRGQACSGLVTNPHWLMGSEWPAVVWWVVVGGVLLPSAVAVCLPGGGRWVGGPRKSLCTSNQPPFSGSLSN